ncbi:signal peptidase I [Patulibacter sp. S7RM1-6]
MLRAMNRWRRNSIVSTVLLVAVALGLVFTVQALAVRPYLIPSGSMRPTLQEGQRVVVERVGHRLGGTPKVGDVIVFHPAAGADDERCASPDQGPGTPTPCAKTDARPSTTTFIKRVVGVPGDRLRIDAGHVVRNGRRASEPFTLRCGDGSDCTFPRAITVPPGTVYVMGDNRGSSEDSRYWGPVRVDWVIGRAVGTYWPPKRIGGL